ncbi:hypothetical protein P8452_10404 [Trifolium repens]|nr:hypothetical protein P8452_10404 [Trifolium repens]
MFSFPNNNFLSSSSSPSSLSYPNTLSSFLENDFPNNNTTLLDHEPIPFTTTTHHDNIVPLFHDHNHHDVSNFSDCNNIGMFEQDTSNFASILQIPNFVVTEQKQLPATVINGGKKDRHSKIHTSQGLRDRRVRLSSEIARKFFDLQDMLEFDKPSNTLEWLFTQSDTAIKELARTKNGGYNDNKALFDSNSNKSFSGGGGGGGGGGDGCSSKGRKLKWTQKEETKKESRERARARARERTCYKMCSSGRIQEEIRYPTTTDSTTTQQMLLQQLMSSTSSPVDSTETEAYARWRQLLQLQTYNNNSSLHNNHNHHNHLLDSDIARDHGGFNVIEESIMIKRNMIYYESIYMLHESVRLESIGRRERIRGNTNLLVFGNI